MAKYLDYNGLAYLWEKIKNALSGKVDKVDGKGLSTNDFTAAEKTKLAGIATGAEVNVNADWNATTGDAAILNKPANLVQDASYVHTDVNFTATLKTKLDGIAAGATKNTVDSALSSTSTNPVQNKAVNTALGKKVDKEDGKGLSSNDYTAEDKTKLDALPAAAQENVIETVKVNGTAQPVASKAVDIAVPSPSSTAPKANGTAAVGTETAFARGDHVHPSDTKKANLASPTFTGTPKAPTAAKGTNTTQLATTAFVQTAIGDKAAKATTLSGYGIADAYTKGETDSAIASAIGGITGVSFKVVTSLPTTGEAGVIYLIAHSHGTGDAYDEYIYLADKESFEKIGNTDVDLSGYLLKTDMTAITNAEIDTICA